MDAAPMFDAASADVQTEDVAPPVNPCPGQAHPASWHIVADPLATCIDGSPALYFFSPGTGAGKNRWLVDLEGGGQCSTVETCRHAAYYTSCRNDLSANGKTGGIFSRNQTDNPYFYQANIVYVLYCSGDLWSGDRAGGADNGNLPFRGRRILADVVGELASQMSTAEEVVLGGQSAGGFGVLVNADRIAAQVAAISASARFSALSDSGWTISSDPSSTTAAERLAAQTFWAMQPDDSCAAANPTQAWRCIEGPTLYPFLSSRTLVFVSQEDSVQTQNAGIAPTDVSGLAAYAQSMRSSFTGVGAPVSAFVPDRFGHTVTDSTPDMQAADVTIGGTTFWTYAYAWLAATGSSANTIGP